MKTENVLHDCTKYCEATQECTVCGQRKKPVGRDAPPGLYLCSYECEGYMQVPFPGHLWPGEFENSE